jgi:hypothetical protein
VYLWSREQSQRLRRPSEYGALYLVAKSIPEFVGSLLSLPYDSEGWS